jgi:hypothetical protein
MNGPGRKFTISGKVTHGSRRRIDIWRVLCDDLPYRLVTNGLVGIKAARLAGECTGSAIIFLSLESSAASLRILLIAPALWLQLGDRGYT